MARKNLMAVEKLRQHDSLFYRLMEDKNMALHASVYKTLRTSREQVAISRKTVSNSQALLARLQQTLRDSNDLLGRNNDVAVDSLKMAR